MRLLLLLLGGLLLLLPDQGLAQSRQVTGKITNQRGEPIPAATVKVKGATTATTTDDSGNFSLAISTSNPVLVISSAGYNELEFRLGTSSTVNLSLQERSDMEEVIVTAFGVKKEKRALGYAAQEINGEDLVTMRQPNVINAMQGKVAGVQINSTGGAPGQGARIIIRGINSLDPSANNQPLFVIDGVVMDNSTVVEGNTQNQVRGMSNRVADINPDDIESMSVLKGGAATALYGSLGSNGVVVITTKSAKTGKMRVNFTTSYGIDEVNKFPDVQRTYTQGQNGVYDSISFWPSWGPTTEAARAIDPSHPEQIAHHYAQGYMKGNQFRTTVNMSGGTEAALLSSSVSYFQQEGTIPNTNYKNISARINGRFKLSDKLSFMPSLNFVNSGGLRYNADRYNESLTYWSPRWNVKDYILPNGVMVWHGNSNPIWGTATNQMRDNVNRVLANGLVNYRPLEWLSVDYRLGIDQYTDFRRHTAPGPRGLPNERTYDNGLGFVNEQRIGNRIINSNLIVTANKDWSSKFNTVVRAGHDLQDYKFHSLYATGSQLDIPELLSLNNAMVRTNSESISRSRLVSVFGDVTLSWDNFLFLNVTARNEWTSTLPEGNNSFFYPSVSLSYVFSDMFKMPSWMTYGKLRASYAEIGKGTGPYRTNSYYFATPLTSTSQIIWSRSDQRGSPGLLPERTKTLEIGTDLKFLNNRLGLEFSWYQLTSTDQILPISVSPTTGYGTFIGNAGKLENKGIELALTATPVRNSTFTWDVNVNFARNRNKIVSLNEGLEEIAVLSQFGYSGATVTQKYIPGYPVGSLFGTTYQRYYGDKEDDGMTVDKSLPMVIGANGFPIYDPTQRLLGNSQPKWLGGITNTFSYKNFALSFLFDTQQGQMRYNQLDNFMAAFGIAKYTENRNDIVTFPGVLANGTENTKPVWLNQGTGPDGVAYGDGYYRLVYRRISENFVQDASWVRLRNLSFSYNLPKALLQNSFIQGASVTVTGNNLILWTDYNGFDPESSSFNAGSNADGFAGFTYPALRSYLLTLNLNF